MKSAGCSQMTTSLYIIMSKIEKMLFAFPLNVDRMFTAFYFTYVPTEFSQ